MREVEDSFDGLIGKQVVLASRSFEVETDVFFCVFEAEGSEAVSKGEAGSQRCEEAEFEDLEEVFDSRDEYAKAVFGVEVVDGKAPKDVGDIGIQSFGIVDDK